VVRRARALRTIPRRFAAPAEVAVSDAPLYTFDKRFARIA